MISIICSVILLIACDENSTIPYIDSTITQTTDQRLSEPPISMADQGDMIEFDQRVLDSIDANLDANLDMGAEGSPNPPDPDPVAGVRYILISSTMSPSWVSWHEVEVIGRPINQQVDNRNLALNTLVTASGSTDDAPPENVVDGDYESAWNAGEFPPCTLKIDLGLNAEIEKIRLLVAQHPAGETIHSISFGDEDDNFQTVHTFQGQTENDQWLEFTYTGNQVSPMPTPNPNLPRGLAWVRNNPMFISALTVSTGAPTVDQVNLYYDDFNANAAHLWNDGITSQLNGWQAANHPRGRWLSWVQNDGTAFNNEVIGGLPASPPGRIGYQVGDEPGLHGDGMTELLEIEEGINAIRRIDPNALLVVNFSFWADEFESLLQYYGSEVDGDVFSYDRYSMGYNEHETLAQVRRVALQWNKPYWRYLKSYHDVGTQNELHPSDYRWTAFLGLLYGYTGHTWFIYQANMPHVVASDLFPSQGDLGQAYLDEWMLISDLNQQMENLGRSITQLTSTDVRYQPGQMLYLPEGLVAWTPGAGDDRYITAISAQENTIATIRDLAIGFFKDDHGEVYVMIQNQQHSSAQFPIANTFQSTVEITFNFNNAPTSLETTQVLMLDHVTGEQQTLPLDNLGGGSMKLVYTLNSGDPLFFKYATGRPFPLGP